MMRLSTTLCISLVGLLFSAFTYAKPSYIDLVYTSHKYNYTDELRLAYNQAPRLEQVLEEAEKQALKLRFSSGYHEGYRLFYQDKSKILAVKTRYTQVINALNELAKDEDYTTAAQVLLKQVQDREYGPRAIINLDLDAVRLDDSIDPKLPGNYRLEIPERPAHVSVLGLTYASEQIFRSRMTVRDYIKTSKVISGANRDYVWVIEPTGKISKVGYAYWNDAHTRLMPGAIIFIGFSSSNDALQQLEQDIVSLLSMVKYKG